MNEHLPECPVEKRLRAGRTVGSQSCICAALRACEQRVQKIAYGQGLGAGSDEHGQHEIGWIKGYAAALNAAREAVKGVNWFNDEGKMLSAIVATADSIAAIDALKEKR